MWTGSKAFEEVRSSEAAHLFGFACCGGPFPPFRGRLSSRMSTARARESLVRRCGWRRRSKSCPAAVSLQVLDPYEPLTPQETKRVLAGRAGPSYDWMPNTPSPVAPPVSPRAPMMTTTLKKNRRIKKIPTIAKRLAPPQLDMNHSPSHRHEPCPIDTSHVRTRIGSQCVMSTYVSGTGACAGGASFHVPG
eukprot:s3491_g3.t2